MVTPFTEADAAEVAGLVSRLYPDRAISAEELLRQDHDQQAAGYHAARVVVRGPAGVLAGFAAYSQSLGQYHPRKFSLELIVAPESRGQGLGSALYRWATTELARHDPLSLRVSVREDDEAARRFARGRGFLEDKRYWVSSLQPALADLSGLPALEERLEGQGVRLLTAADLALHDPHGWQARIHALFSEVRLDVPRSEPPTPISLEQFCGWILDDDGFLPQAYWLAQARNGELVGLSDLYRSPASADLFIGLTGVRKPWRGLGLATALKLRGLRYAAEQGVPRVWTDNESGNAPILSINDRLGFVREPAVLSLVKVVAAGEPA